MPLPLRTAAATAILMAAALNLSTQAHAQGSPDPACRGVLGAGFPPPGDGPRAGHAGGHPPFQHGLGMGHVPPWLQGLDLSAPQKDQVFQILHDHEIALRDAAKAAHAQRLALHAASLTAGTAPAQLQALAAAAGQADSALALQMAQTDQLLLAVLTPEQQGVLSTCVATVALAP